MSLEDDLAKLERQVNNFSIAGAAGNFHTGFSIGDDARGSGAGAQRARIGPTPEDRIAFLEQSFKSFTIRGGHDVSVTGSLVVGGFAISAKAAPSGEGTGGGGPTPTGACCIGASCSVLTSDDCATMGGTYQGDGVGCGDVTCGACPELTLVCDSVSASKSKCGLAPFGGGPCYSATFTDPSSSCSLCGDSGSIGDGQVVDPGSECDCNALFLTRVTTMSACDDMPNAYQVCHQCNYSPVGSDIADTSGSGTITQTDTYNTTTCEASTENVGTISFETCYPAAFCSDVFTGCSACDPGPCVTGTVEYTDIASLSGCVILDGVAHSDEYTTGALITNTEGALPSYPGTFDGSCVASRELSGDEHSYAIQRFKYKWTFSSATVAFTITWNEHTDFDDMTTSDNPRSTSISIGETETSVFECLEPSANGTTTITDIVCTVD